MKIASGTGIQKRPQPGTALNHALTLTRPSDVPVSDCVQWPRSSRPLASFAMAWWAAACHERDFGRNSGTACDRRRHPHFVKEEEYALPPLGLLATIARQGVTPEMRAVLTMTELLKKDLPEMLAEHQRVVGALEKLAAESRVEKRPDAERFAQKLRVHAETEEHVLYPAAILVGEYVRARLGL